MRGTGLAVAVIVVLAEIVVFVANGALHYPCEGKIEGHMNTIDNRLRECIIWRDTHIDTITKAQGKGDPDAAEIIRISEHCREYGLTVPMAIILIKSVEQFREKMEVRK